MSKLPALADITFPEGWQDMDINQKKQLCFVGNDTQVANLKRIIIKNPKNLIERKAIPAQMAIQHVCNELKKERTKMSDSHKNANEYESESSSSDKDWFGTVIEDPNDYSDDFINKFMSSLIHNPAFDNGFLIDKQNRDKDGKEVDSVCHCPLAKAGFKFRSQFNVNCLQEKDKCKPKSNVMTNQQLLQHCFAHGERGGFLHMCVYQFLKNMYPNILGAPKTAKRKSNHFRINYNNFGDNRDYLDARKQTKDNYAIVIFCLW